MYCFFGKGEQCNYIHCNSAGGEGCLSHKGWQNKREREKRRRHFQLKQLKFLLRVLYILNPPPTIYTVSNKLHSSHTHTCTKRAWSSICFQLDIHTASCKSLIALSISLSRTHACLYTHAFPHACTQTHTHAHTHTPSAQSTLSLCSSILIFLILKVLLILIFHLQTKQWLCCKENKIHKATSAFNHTWKGIIIYGAPSHRARVFTKAYTHTHTRAYMTECT